MIKYYPLHQALFLTMQMRKERFKYLKNKANEEVKINPINQYKKKKDLEKN